MNKLVPCVLFLALCPLLLLAQQRWERTYGGPGDDFGYSGQQTADGGYIVAGYSNSFGNSNQVYLIKVDSLGDTLWTRTYGGAFDDRGYSVRQTTDLGYVIAGVTNSFGNGNQVYLIRTDASGDTLWTRTYGDTMNQGGNSVQQTSDGGYIITGYSRSIADHDQVYLLRTDSTGGALWMKTYGGRADDVGNSVQETSDGGFIVAGVLGDTVSSDSTRMYLFKTNASGDTLWSSTYRGYYGTRGYSVQQTRDTGYIASGSHWNGSVGGGSVTILVKTDAFGSTRWLKNWGHNDGNSVWPTSDGGYIVTGGLRGMGGSLVDLAKANASGERIWDRSYSGGVGQSVQQTTDGGYFIAGRGSRIFDVHLVKTDSLGNTVVEEEENDARCTILDARLKIYPNLFRRRVAITLNIADQATGGSGGGTSGHQQPALNIYDALGRVAKSFSVGSLLVAHRSLLVTWDGTDDHGQRLPAGVYMVRFTAGEHQETHKVVVVR